MSSTGWESKKQGSADTEGGKRQQDAGGRRSGSARRRGDDGSSQRGTNDIEMTYARTPETKIGESYVTVIRISE